MIDSIKAFQMSTYCHFNMDIINRISRLIDQLPKPRKVIEDRDRVIWKCITSIQSHFVTLFGNCNQEPLRRAFKDKLDRMKVILLYSELDVDIC